MFLLEIFCFVCNSCYFTTTTKKQTKNRSDSRLSGPLTSRTSWKKPLKTAWRLLLLVFAQCNAKNSITGTYYLQWTNISSFKRVWEAIFLINFFFLLKTDNTYFILNANKTLISKYLMNAHFFFYVLFQFSNYYNQQITKF